MFFNQGKPRQLIIELKNGVNSNVSANDIPNHRQKKKDLESKYTLQCASDAEYDVLKSMIEKQTAAHASSPSKSTVSDNSSQSVLADQCLRIYDWEQLQQLSTPTEYAPGEVICQKGDYMRGIYQVEC